MLSHQSALAGSIFFGASSLVLYGVLAQRRWQTRFLSRGPLAKRTPHRVLFGAIPGQNRGPSPMSPPKERTDYYYWMRDDTRSDPTVLRHIERENQYTELKTAHLQPLQQTLYDEFLSHMKETDTEVPYKHGPYLYYSRTQKGLAYKIHCRKSIATEEDVVILDVNKVAEGHEYCDVHGVSPSPSHEILSYAVDTTGDETYDVRFLDTRLGGIVPMEDVLHATSGDIAWGADDSVLYYTTMDEEHRPYKLWLHVLGTDQSQDLCLFEEPDQRMWISIGKSDSERFLMLDVDCKETSEFHVIDLQGLHGPDAHLAAPLRCIEPRVHGHRYDVNHHGDYFYILTNRDGGLNNRLMRTPITATAQSNWQEIRPYSNTQKLDYLQCFRGHMVIQGRAGGVRQIWVVDMEQFGNDSSVTRYEHAIDFPEPVYSAGCTDNYEYDTNKVRLWYSSFITPSTILDYDMADRSREIKQTKEVPNYDPSLYESTRIDALARDGTMIPVSLVYRTDARPTVPRPMVLYGYGSYGSCIDPSFDHTRLSFLDRGVVYAIAHIRGGGEMGRYWYEQQGKYLTKKNTFNDFVDCAQHLIREHYTAPDRLAIVGRSAGGLLIGATVNMRPDLFRVAVADVPFVDALTTMADPTIPLTITEWEEWGNPNEEKYYQYMSEYAPYDNVKAQNYPAMLVTGGLHDPRVAYWEPCKWVAKLRELKTDDNLLCLKIDMDSGHFSASDRYKYMRERAFEFAFMLYELDAMELLRRR